MATLSEMFIGDIQKQNSEPLSKSDAGWQTGIQLAQMKQQREQQMQQLQQKQQELQLAKYEKLGNWMDSYAKMPEGGAKKAFGDNFIPTGIKALGLEDKIDPTVMQMMLKDSDYATGVVGMIRDGRLTPTDLNDAEKMGKVYPLAAQDGAAIAISHGKEVADAYNQRLNDVSAEKRAEQAAKNAGNKADDQWGRFNEQRQIDLSKELIKNKIPQLTNTMQKINAAIPTGLDGWQKGQQLPGFDGVNSRKPINSLKGEALKLRQAAEQAKNQIMALTSGQTVTPDEAVRVMAMIGMVPSYDQNGILKDFTLKGAANPEAFVNGMRNIRDTFKSVDDTLRAGYGNNYDVVMKRLGDQSARGGNFANATQKPVDLKQAARNYLRDHPTGKGAAQAKKILSGGAVAGGK